MTHNNVVAAFTEMAPTYEDTMERELLMLWGLNYTQFVERLAGLAAVKPGEQVLDIASGTARLPTLLGSATGDEGSVVGVDITPRMLAHSTTRLDAAKAALQVHLVCGSAMQLPLMDDSFDLVTCALGLHHMAVPTVLAEMRRVMAGGGRLVLVAVGARPSWRAPGVDTAMRAITFFYFRARGSRTRAGAEADAVVNVHTAAEWRSILVKAGFDQVEVRREFEPRHIWYPYGLALMARKRE